MNEHQYTNIHQYLVGISSTLAQMLKAQQRTVELLTALHDAPAEIFKLRDDFDTSQLDTKPVIVRGESKIERVPPARTDSEPWSDYDSMNIAEVLAKAALVTDDERDWALTYELRHKNRRGIIDKMEDWGT